MPNGEATTYFEAFDALAGVYLEDSWELTGDWGKLLGRPTDSRVTARLMLATTGARSQRHVRAFRPADRNSPRGHQ